MKSLMLAFVLILGKPSQSALFDFGKAEIGKNWFIINDGVMGGLSQAEVILTDTSLKFKGEISLDNNGGFSSLRSPFKMMDLSSFKTLRIRYRSRMQNLDFVLENDRRFYKPNFKYNLPETNWEWNEIEFDLYESNAVIMGRSTDIKMSKTYLSELIRHGFICANKESGPFEIEIDYLKYEK